MGGAAVAASAVFAAKPGSNGDGGHNAYFQDVANAMAKAGVGTPRLVIDLDRLTQNAHTIQANIDGAMALRIVAKSLPSFPLLDFISRLTGSQRIMTFNLPFLKMTAEQRPAMQQLLGKPMPVAAAADFFQSVKAGDDAVGSIEWLIDTPERAKQYADLAVGLERKLKMNIEIDVGLHRGGAKNADDLKEIFSIVAGGDHLIWSGLMGYDAHLGSVIEAFGIGARQIERSKAAYDDMFNAATEITQRRDTAELTLNTAGSPTYRLHDGGRAPNELAIGSAFAKPTHFDGPLLADLAPASFIAAPVLKTNNKFQLIDGAEWIAAAKRFWNPNSRQAFYIYGGHWLADPVSPKGLQVDGLYGESSNQQLLTGAPSVDLNVDEPVFFRPSQSEAVFTRFGDILIYQNGEIVDEWPVFPAHP
jgi:D-serine deaminase-like pyridoxal phosphate-dependent protein